MFAELSAEETKTKTGDEKEARNGQFFQTFQKI